MAVGATVLVATTSAGASAQQVATISSTNWTGVVAVRAGFIGVEGTWTVPSITLGNAGALSAWVGIDDGGPNSHEILQAGTRDDGSGPYFNFETFPAPNVPLTLPVAAGDVVTVSIAREARGIWTTSFTDLTTGAHDEFRFPYLSHNTTAECIVEGHMPPGGDTVVLPAFGSFVFNECKATSGQSGASVPISHFAYYLVSIGTQTAPTDLQDDGGFTVIQR